MISVYSLIIIFIMLIFNAVFAAYEMGIASVSRTRLRVLAQEKKKGAENALFMKERIEGSFAVIQLGITLAGAIAAATGGAGVEEAIAPFFIEKFHMSKLMAEILALIIFIIPLSAVTIIFGELVPKTFAIKNREWICLKLSTGMKFLYIVSFPIVSFFEKIVKLIMEKGSKHIGSVERHDLPSIHELKSIASMARVSSLIGVREEKIVHAAAELSTRAIKEIMIPIEEISMIPINLSLTEALIMAHTDMHTRFPVCSQEGGSKSIIGYINLKDIIYVLHAKPADPNLKAIVRTIKSFNVDTKISATMEEMIQSAIHIALVRDTDGTVLGMVTLEDILEELVGEILDEYDRLPSYIHPYGNGWIMAGGAPLEKVAEVTGTPINNLKPQEQAAPNTLAQLCRFVKKGEVKGAEAFEYGGLIITVRKFRRKQVLEAFVTISDKI